MSRDYENEFGQDEERFRSRSRRRDADAGAGYGLIQIQSLPGGRALPERRIPG